ncbi:Zn(II)2Cys6 transcription factor [Aspergillus vadensis CBS 113365]|uniref:Zn(2)-C6 fungal-type domain-containing protein n=1 Tax=Aspergillus vadensis (strain CBS 113365 / IMI 142717 / IBT 24658) TaxID=1448311 RepID=A0A319AWK5_ASPVC|nr:hypothetical protein BO88DRAFT_375326 [Aspergillus vadensis CBS 113365]PYH63984.1 hypothetical protein BO88DRAFT_375326 [Aspergillus vadensis CBS 113365]
MENKVPIPRISVAPGQQQISRTHKACQPCGEKKRKCSGDQPICRQCGEAGIYCIYRESKRQQRDREVNGLANQLQISHALLRQILPELGPDSARQTMTDLVNRHLPPLVQQSGFADKEVSPGDNMRSTVSDPKGEDSNRNLIYQANGFVGGHSEIAWLCKMRREFEQNQRPATAGHDPCLQYEQTFRDLITAIDYPMDESDLPIDMDVDIFGVPLQKIADDLINHYFDIVHPFFPIIDKPIFREQLASFYSKKDVRPGKRWLASLNLIFAIASRYRGLAYDDNRTGNRDDLKYFCKAWKLYATDLALANHPDLQQVQVEGLITFYLLSIGQINSSWRICGLSMRSAMTMGIHLQNESPGISPNSKENRCRVWWSLYTLDITLCLKTGRGPNLNTEFITAPLPQPCGDEAVWKVSGPVLIRKCRGLSQLIGPLLLMIQHQQRDQNPEISSIDVTIRDRLERNEDVNGSLALDTSRYFLSFVQLTLLMRQSIESLHAPAGSKEPWNVRAAITISLITKLDEWASQLLPELQFQDTKAQSDAYTRQRVGLAFRSYSTKLLLLRPFLHRATRESSSELCEKLADSCVEAAYQMLSLFPDCPDTSWLYETSPWWCTLHYLMQSMIVFLLKLQHEKQKGLVTTNELANCLGKSVRWLRDMSTRDPPSERAWKICKEIIMNHFPCI